MGLSQLPHLSGRSRFNFLDPGAGYELLSIWISPVDGLDVEYGGQLENRGSLALPCLNSCIKLGFSSGNVIVLK